MNAILTAERTKEIQRPISKVDTCESGGVLFVGYQRETMSHLHRTAEDCGFTPAFISDLSKIERYTSQHEPIKAIFTDSRFLGFNSRHDWSRFREIIGVNPLWIHISDDSRPEFIVGLMKNGLDDFLSAHSASIHIEKYLSKLNYLFAKKHSKIARVERDATLLRKRVEWSTYTESLRKAWNDISGREAISNLQTNLSQGAGFGLLLSLVEILEMSKDADRNIQVDAYLFNKVKENTQYTRRLLESLSTYVGVIDNPIRIEPVSIKQIEKKLINRIPLFRDVCTKKRIQLQMSETFNHHEIKVNPDFLVMGVDELIVNALKYSRQETDVNILTSIHDGYYSITVQSFPDISPQLKKESASIERLKLPFFRAHPPVEYIVEMEKFVMGLGLPAVEQIASKMNSIFKLEMGKDYRNLSIEPCVLANFMIPLV